MSRPPRQACWPYQQNWPSVVRVVVLIIVLAYLLVLMRQGLDLDSTVAVLAAAVAAVRLLAPTPGEALSS